MNGMLNVLFYCLFDNIETAASLFWSMINKVIFIHINTENATKVAKWNYL